MHVCFTSPKPISQNRTVISTRLEAVNRTFFVSFLVHFLVLFRRAPFQALVRYQSALRFQGPRFDPLSSQGRSSSSRVHELYLAIDWKAGAVQCPGLSRNDLLALRQYFWSIGMPGGYVHVLLVSIDKMKALSGRFYVLFVSTLGCSSCLGKLMLP